MRQVSPASSWSLLLLDSSVQLYEVQDENTAARLSARAENSVFYTTFSWKGVVHQLCEGLQG